MVTKAFQVTLFVDLTRFTECYTATAFSPNECSTCAMKITFLRCNLLLDQQRCKGQNAHKAVHVVRQEHQ
jgi:hypothetical protein